MSSSHGICFILGPDKHAIKIEVRPGRWLNGKWRNDVPSDSARSGPQKTYLISVSRPTWRKHRAVAVAKVSLSLFGVGRPRLLSLFHGGEEPENQCL